MSLPAKEQVLSEAFSRLQGISGVTVSRSKTEIDYEALPFIILNMGEYDLPPDIQIHGRDRVQMAFSIIIGVRVDPDDSLDTALNALHRDVIVALIGSDPGFSGLAIVQETGGAAPDSGDEQGHGNVGEQTLFFLADFQTTQYQPDALITN